jgi:hypothetical protein
MKKIVIFLIALLVFSDAFTQSKDNSITFNTGMVFPGKKLSEEYNPGLFAGIDYQFHDNPFSFFIEGNLNFFNTRVDMNGNTTTEGILDLTAGPRYFVDLKKFHPFLDFGMGFYNDTKSYYITSLSFGFRLGAGTEIKINDNFDVLIKAKYHLFFVNGTGSNYRDYSGLCAGIKYNF